jgi:hypothetical protein
LNFSFGSRIQYSRSDLSFRWHTEILPCIPVRYKLLKMNEHSFSHRRMNPGSV